MSRVRTLAAVAVIALAGSGGWHWLQSSMESARLRDAALAQDSPTEDQSIRAAHFIDRKITDLIQPGPGDRWTAKALYGYETAIVRPESRSVRCSSTSIEIRFGPDVSVYVFFTPHKPTDEWPDIHPAYWRGPAGKALISAMCRRTEERLAAMISEG